MREAEEMLVNVTRSRVPASQKASISRFILCVVVPPSSLTPLRPGPVNDPRWAYTADAECNVSSARNPLPSNSPLKAWSGSESSFACRACCQDLCLCNVCLASALQYKRGVDQGYREKQLSQAKRISENMKC